MKRRLPPVEPAPAPFASKAGRAFAALALLLALAGCTSAPRPAPPPAASTPAPADPRAEGSSPAAPAAPAAPKAGAPAPAATFALRIVSEPAGALILVDDRILGKAPLTLQVAGTAQAFFKDYLRIKARFVAADEAQTSVTVTEAFSPRERIPGGLTFTVSGARRHDYHAP